MRVRGDDDEAQAAWSSDDALARAEARIRDLEAALEASQRRLAEYEREGARPALAEASSELRFRALIDNLHVGVVVQGPRSEILLFNPRALELLGLSEDEFLGRTSFDPSWQVIRENGEPFLPEERPVAMVLATRAPVSGVVMGINRPRTSDRVWLLVNASPECDANGEVVQVVATMDDITDRKHLLDSLRESDQLDSLGLLAGGIAHDFNNLLTIIDSSAELARIQLPEDAEVQTEITGVLEATQRASALTRQLLSFARRNVGTPQRLALGAAVGEFEKLLRRLLGSEHALEVQAHDAPVAVRIDQGQLEQILVNLVVNARDAMPEGGVVTIETSALSPGRAPAPLDERAAACLCVADTGTGIPPKVLARVLEPLFTTKASGKGTGLGLATVAAIVRQAGGQLEIDSEVGVGTRVGIYLPLLVGAALDELGAEPAPGFGQGELILVVESDPVLRSVSARMLGELGYRTLEAEDGYAALEQLVRREGRVDLVLTEIVMPRMGGLELTARIRERWPGVRVVATAEVDEAKGATEVRVDAVVAKPYNMGKLGRALTELLAPAPQ